MSQNRPKWAQTSFFWSKAGVLGQNQSNPVFFGSKLTKTGGFGQKPVFISQNRPKPLFRPKLTKTSFFWSKPSFFGQNQPTPVFLVKVDQNPFFVLVKTQFFFSRNRPKLVFPVKIDQNPFVFVKNQFFPSKSTKTRFSGQSQPTPSPFSSVLIPSLD